MSAIMQRIIGIILLNFGLWPLLTLAAVLPEGRIISGELSKPQQFPYQAGLHLYKENKEGWCGGALISDRWVLTAAACTYDLGKGLDLYLGTWNRLDTLEKSQQVIYIINNERNIIVHEKFSASLQRNDISLVKIPAVIRFSEYIYPVKLPVVGDTIPDFDGEIAVVSGWGYVKNSATEMTNILRWYPAPVVTNERCNHLWMGRATPSNICTMIAGRTTCTGDTGGPLVLQNSRTLIGISTFPQSICNMIYPAVFTRVTFYLDWIELHSGVVP